MNKKIICGDNYEAQKLASLIYVKEDSETFVAGILEIIENEIIILLKDKSAHSVLFKNKSEAESFADFIQSVVEKKHRLTNTTVFEDIVEVIKE